MRTKIEKQFYFFWDEWTWLDLTPVEQLIMMHINSYAAAGKECRLTDDQLSELINVCRKTISTSLANLENKGLIKRFTVTQSDNGKISKHRTMIPVKVLRNPEPKQYKSKSTKKPQNNLQADQKVCTGVSEITF
jgi:zona occludens toxin (predicted ATPase)